MSVWNKWGMQFERFYRLNQSIVAWFVHFHQVWFHPTLTNLGKHLWWYWCEWEAICPSTTWEGTQTPHTWMTLTWDTVWKVLQPQSKHSGMVCTLASGRTSANFPKSGEASVVVTVSVKPYAHPQPEKLLKTLHRNVMDMECSLKGSTASTKV